MLTFSFFLRILTICTESHTSFTVGLILVRTNAIILYLLNSNLSSFLLLTHRCLLFHQRHVATPCAAVPQSVPVSLWRHPADVGSERQQQSSLLRGIQLPDQRGPGDSAQSAQREQLPGLVTQDKWNDTITIILYLKNHLTPVFFLSLAFNMATDLAMDPEYLLFVSSKCYEAAHELLVSDFLKEHAADRSAGPGAQTAGKHPKWDGRLLYEPGRSHADWKRT